MPEPYPDTLHSVAAGRAMDAAIIAAGLPGFQLMQRAADAMWCALARRWPNAQAITVLAGAGNNAGDGYLIACLAQRAGYPVRVWAIGDPEKLKGDAALAYQQALAFGVQVLPWQDDAWLAGVLVDALLGTGVQGAPRAPYSDVIERINASGLPVFAVDLPSGLNGATGQAAGTVVRADLTVTVVSLKRGLFTADGPAQVGELAFDPLATAPAGVPDERPVRRLTAANLSPVAPRPANAHKGMFGHLLLIGGDRGTGGAGLLMAEMALRAGAGLVSLATHPDHVAPALARLPEVMVLGVQAPAQLMALVEKADILVVGPGLGQGPWGRSLLTLAATTPKPQVWDADALNLLAQGLVQLPANSVITPHPGEAARLLGTDVAQVQTDRFAAVQALAQRYQCTAVLKGAGSLIASADGAISLCDHGHGAMAGAGLGDVLSGLIGALLGQGLAGFDAACLAVWLHTRAGQALGRTRGRGLLATDLVPVVRQLLEEHSPCQIPQR